jgi:hypothetical protein
VVFSLKRLERYDWETESLTLRASLDRPQGEAELRSAVERAELILLAFPLYADALPYLATRALATMAAHRPPDYKPFSQRLVAVVNSGFPETHQNAVALAICREFATQYAFSWAGSLAFAAGGMIGGHPLTDAKRPGPPVPNVIAALEMAATTLAAGLPVPAEAMKMITRQHIPLGLWNRLYMYMGGRGFQKQAAKNGVNKEQLLAQPTRRDYLSGRQLQSPPALIYGFSASRIASLVCCRAAHARNFVNRIPQQLPHIAFF